MVDSIGLSHFVTPSPWPALLSEPDPRPSRSRSNPCPSGLVQVDPDPRSEAAVQLRDDQSILFFRAPPPTPSTRQGAFLPTRPRWVPSPSQKLYFWQFGCFGFNGVQPTPVNARGTPPFDRGEVFVCKECQSSVKGYKTS
jgi:hypothetical protein